MGGEAEVSAGPSTGAQHRKARRRERLARVERKQRVGVFFLALLCSPARLLWFRKLAARLVDGTYPRPKPPAPCLCRKCSRARRHGKFAARRERKR